MAEVINIKAALPSVEAYHALATEVRARLKNMSGIRSAFIYGSYDRGDFVPGWSDLDVMVIHQGEAVPEAFIESLRGIKEEVGSKLPINLTFKIHSKDEIPDYHIVDGSLHPFFLKAYAESRNILVGEQPSTLFAPLLVDFSLPRYAHFLGQRIYVERHRLRSAISSITDSSPFDFSIHLPPNYLAIGAAGGLFTRAAKSIDAVLDCAMYANGIANAHTMHKDTICEVFEDAYRGLGQDRLLPRRANALRLQWGIFDRGELENFIKQGYSFVNKVHAWVQEKSLTSE